MADAPVVAVIDPAHRSDRSVRFEVGLPVIMRAIKRFDAVPLKPEKGNEMTNEAPDKLMTVEGVSDMLSMSRSSIWRKVKSGDLPQPVKIGGCTRWRLSDLLAVIEEAA